MSKDTVVSILPSTTDMEAYIEQGNTAEEQLEIVEAMLHGIEDIAQGEETEVMRFYAELKLRYAALQSIN